MRNMIVHSTSFLNGYRSQKTLHLIFCIHSSEFEKTQWDSPQPEARVVPDQSQTPGEESSVSEYFSCVSSPGKLQSAAENGKGDTKAGQDQ